MLEQLVGLLPGGLAVVARDGDVDVGGDDRAAQRREALGTAGRAVASRGGALPVLSGVRVEVRGNELRLTGSDLDLTIQVTATVAGGGDGVTVVPSRLASDIVRALEPGAVDVEVDDDEALVIETELPKRCRYWQLLVADDRFSTIDWVNRQSSLNDSQARVDSDGRLRAVISRRDPGVPNWLDKADVPWGVIQMRWNKASDHPDPAIRPQLLEALKKEDSEFVRPPLTRSKRTSRRSPSWTCSPPSRRHRLAWAVKFTRRSRTVVTRSDLSSPNTISTTSEGFEA